ncbi:MAG: antibiotic biosynthesis monooxygenase [Thermoplasmata archaeon]|nr:antibiotic biosynthesis monooxygenase [Thermoplasmata archaeon]
MVWVGVNRITVDSAEEAEQIVNAFRHRAGKVDRAPGFLKFELWKEEKGREVMVLTHWREQADFQHWIESPAFREAHRHAEGSPGQGAGGLYEVVL